MLKQIKITKISKKLYEKWMKTEFGTEQYKIVALKCPTLLYHQVYF